MTRGGSMGGAPKAATRPAFCARWWWVWGGGSLGGRALEGSLPFSCGGTLGWGPRSRLGALRARRLAPPAAAALPRPASACGTSAAAPPPSPRPQNPSENHSPAAPRTRATPAWRTEGTASCPCRWGSPEARSPPAGAGAGGRGGVGRARRGAQHAQHADGRRSPPGPAYRPHAAPRGLGHLCFEFIPSRAPPSPAPVLAPRSPCACSQSAGLGQLRGSVE